MTMISVWLRAEAQDKTEPASYYIPGADDWDDLQALAQRGKRTKRIKDELRMIYEVEWFEDE